MKKKVPFYFLKVRRHSNSYSKAISPEKNKLSSYSEDEPYLKTNPFILLESESKNKSHSNNFERINKEDNNSASLSHSSYHYGRWTDEEHYKFLKGILEYGNEWKKVQKEIKTRSSTQARSHAQKFYLKLNNIMKNRKFSNSKENIFNYIFSSSQKELSLEKEQKKKLLDVIITNLNKFENKSGRNSEKPNNLTDNLKSGDNKNNENIVTSVNIDNNEIKKNKEKELIFYFKKCGYYNQKKKKVFLIKKVERYNFSKKGIKNNQKIKKMNIKVNKRIKSDNIEKLCNHNVLYPIINGNYIINHNIINITNNYYNNSSPPSNHFINNCINSKSYINNKINNNNAKKLNINNEMNYNNANVNMNEKIINYECVKSPLEEDIPVKLHNYENPKKKVPLDFIGLNEPFKNPFFFENFLKENDEDDEISMSNNNEYDFLNIKYLD